MSDKEKTPSYGRTLLHVGVMAGGFIGAILIGHQVFLDSGKPPPAPEPTAAASSSSVTGGGFTLTSASIALPDDDQPYPDGPRADLMNANCTACHSASMALTQPALSKAQWTSTVEKMRKTYKATIAEKDIPAIVDYLTGLSAKLNGKESAKQVPTSDTGGAAG